MTLRRMFPLGVLLGCAALGCSRENPTLQGSGGVSLRKDGRLGAASEMKGETLSTTQKAIGDGTSSEGGESGDAGGDGMGRPPLTPSQLTDAFYVSEPAQRTGLRRLTRAELLAETRRVVGTDLRFESVSLENKPGSHSTQAVQLGISDVSKLREIARAFTDVSSRTALSSLVPCPTGDGPDSTCVKGALRTLAEKVLRGSLSDAEFNTLHAKYKSERQASGHEFAVKALLQELFLSPRSLYLVEGGTTPKQRAERLLARTAFFLTGQHSPAASALVADGSLSRAEYLGFVDELLASSVASEGLARIVSHWFGMGTLAPSYKPVETANLDSQTRANLEADMWTEFRLLTEDVLLKRNEPLGALFSSESTFVNGTLANIYGMNLSAGSPFTKVSLAGTSRRGILTTAAVLFANSKEQGRSPMQRGKFLSLNLMCHRFPDGLAAQMILPEGAKALPSMREKFAVLEKAQPCASCHTMLGAGFAFDRFDPLGREYPESITPESETRTSYQAPGRDPLALQGAVAAAVALASQDDVPRCFTRRAYEFALGREAGTDDAAHLETAYTTFKAGGFKVKALLRAIAESPEFLAGVKLD